MEYIIYNFKPGDEVYVHDNVVANIKHGTVCQFEGDIYPSVDNSIMERKRYLILFDGDDGTTQISTDYVFETLNEAMASLNAVFNPPPINWESPDIEFKLSDDLTSPLLHDTQNKTYGFLAGIAPHNINSQTFNVTAPNGNNEAIRLNGAYVIFPFHKTMLNNVRGEISVFMWIKTTSLLPQTLFSIMPTSTLPTTINLSSINIRTVNGIVESTVVKDDDSFVTVNGGINIDDNMWHHIGITSNGVNTTLYIDGNIMDTSISAGSNIRIPNNTLGYIGNSSDSDTVFIGDMFGVKVWDYMLPNDYINYMFTQNS